MGAEFNARDVLQTHHRAVVVFANDDVAEFFFGYEPALRGDGIGEFLAVRGRRAAHETGGIGGVLRIDGADDIIDRQVEFCQLVRLDPEAHGILAGTEDIDVGNALQLGDLIDEIDVGVIGKEGGGVRAFG